MSKQRKILHKAFGHVVEVKQEDRNGIPLGIVEGYIATWDVDRGADRFVKGAFSDSIEDHRKKGRPVRLLNNHGDLIGGFPVATLREDDKGLYGIGEINLEVQQGQEAYALAKQGVLSDFSVGYSVIQDSMEGNIRVISKALLWEGSVTPEPMNPAAKIVSVKSAVPFQDLPIADPETEWENEAADARVREFTDSEDAPSEQYREAFLWFDRENAENFEAYKLQIADVIDGRLVAVPRAIFAAAAAMAGARGGVDMPDADRPEVIANLERYYAKMDMPSPFEEDGAEEASMDNDDDEKACRDDEEKSAVLVADVKNMGTRDIEQALRAGRRFSKSAAKYLAGRIFNIKNIDEPIKQAYTDMDLKALTDDLDALRKDLGLADK